MRMGMTTTVNHLNFVAASLLAGASILAQSDGNRLAVPFSDPSRPGTIKVSLFNGGITVRASTGREVIVTTDDAIVSTREGREISVPQRPEIAGLRRLTQRSGLRIEEENNVMTIGSGRAMSGDDVTIQAPAKTNLILSTVNGDDVIVEGVDGAIEVTTVNAEIRLTNVAGTVVAHATNGNVRATLRQVTPGKPMAFTSFNGEVDVTMPPSVKANLKLRSDRGEVYTDFDVQIQQQRPAPTAAKVLVAPPFPPLPPLPPGTDADSVEARERAVRERERRVRERAGRTRIDVDTSIYGSVNGGGPEFELRTFNGNIYLRKGK